MAKRLILGLWAWLVFAVISTGCSSPTGPTEPTLPAPVVWRWVDATAEEKAWGDALWPKLKECLEDKLPDPQDYPITVYPKNFMCGTVDAAGCFRFSSIDVGRPWFRNALMVEMFHYSLWRRNINFMGKGTDKPSPLIGHALPARQVSVSDVDNPLFGKCEYLGY